MIEEDEYRGQEWSLGDDSDCDTCGWSYNTAEFDPDWNDKNAWMFRYSVGCYGGASLSCNDEDREEKLSDMFKHLRQYPGWNRRLDVTIRNWIDKCDEARNV